MPINRLCSAVFEVSEHISILWNMLMTCGFLKASCSLSTTRHTYKVGYDISTYPLAQNLVSNSARYLKTILKILVDRALMHHIYFLFNGFFFYARLITCCVLLHNNQCKQSVPRFPLYIQSNVSQVKQSPHANIQLFWSLSNWLRNLGDILARGLSNISKHLESYARSS